MLNHKLTVRKSEGSQIEVFLDGHPLELAAEEPGLRIEFGPYGEPAVFLHLLCREVELELDDVELGELEVTGLEVTDPVGAMWAALAETLNARSERAFAEGHDELAEHLADAAVAAEQVEEET